jgi:hypothetical protein
MEFQTASVSSIDSTPSIGSISSLTSETAGTLADSSPSSSNTGAIVGGVLGGLLFLILLIVLAFFVWRKRKSAAGEERGAGMSEIASPQGISQGYSTNYASMELSSPYDHGNVAVRSQYQGFRQMGPDNSGSYGELTMGTSESDEKALY